MRCVHIFQKKTGGHIQSNCTVGLTISAGKNPNRTMDIPQQFPGMIVPEPYATIYFPYK